MYNSGAGVREGTGVDSQAATGILHSDSDLEEKVRLDLEETISRRKNRGHGGVLPLSGRPGEALILMLSKNIFPGLRI